MSLPHEIVFAVILVSIPSVRIIALPKNTPYEALDEAPVGMISNVPLNRRVLERHGNLILSTVTLVRRLEGTCRCGIFSAILSFN